MFIVVLCYTSGHCVELNSLNSFRHIVDAICGECIYDYKRLNKPGKSAQASAQASVISRNLLEITVVFQISICIHIMNFCFCRYRVSLARDGWRNVLLIDFGGLATCLNTFKRLSHHTFWLQCDNTKPKMEPWGILGLVLWHLHSLIADMFIVVLCYTSGHCVEFIEFISAYCRRNLWWMYLRLQKAK